MSTVATCDRLLGWMREMCMSPPSRAPVCSVQWYTDEQHALQLMFIDHCNAAFTMPDDLRWRETIGRRDG
jgi:hypothetical protein